MPLKSQNNKTAAEDVIILSEKLRYGVAISWDQQKGLKCDLDLQAIVVDHGGHIIDAVYYNNMRSMGGSILHMGEHAVQHAREASSTLDECIWMDVGKLPEEVNLVIFVVAVHHGPLKKGGKVPHLKDAKFGEIQILKHNMSGQIKTFRIEDCAADVDIVCLFKRHADGTLSIRPVEEPALDGSHFLDIIEPSIGGLIRKHIRHAPRFQHVSFNMDKGAVMEFAANDRLKRVTICLGGSVPAHAVADVDIETSCVFLNEAGEILGYVDNEIEKGLGAYHPGAEPHAHHHQVGDDESMTLVLSEIPAEVAQIFLILNVTLGTFDQVETMYVRVVDQDLNELVVFENAHLVQKGSVHHDTLGDTKESGLVVARLFKPDQERFGFQAVGCYCPGHSWREAESTIQSIFSQTPHEVHGHNLPLEHRAPEPSLAREKRPDEAHLDNDAFLNKKIDETQQLELARETSLLASRASIRVQAPVDTDESQWQQEQKESAVAQEQVILATPMDGTAPALVAPGAYVSNDGPGPNLSRSLSVKSMYGVRSGSRLNTMRSSTTAIKLSRSSSNLGSRSVSASAFTRTDSTGALTKSKSIVTLKRDQSGIPEFGLPKDPAWGTGKDDECTVKDNEVIKDSDTDACRCRIACIG